VAIMSARSDLMFIACSVGLLMVLDHSLLWIGLLAATHRTLNFDQALRRELYPHLSA
jgi:hypothetical protein